MCEGGGIGVWGRAEGVWGGRMGQSGCVGWGGRMGDGVRGRGIKRVDVS